MKKQIIILCLIGAFLSTFCVDNSCDRALKKALSESRDTLLYGTWDVRISYAPNGNTYIKSQHFNQYGTDLASGTYKFPRNIISGDHAWYTYDGDKIAMNRGTPAEGDRCYITTPEYKYFFKGDTLYITGCLNRTDICGLPDYSLDACVRISK